MSKELLTEAENQKPLVITIDGLASSGKSTVASKLAKNLGILHLNSGLLYRGLAFLAVENSQDNSNPDNIGSINFEETKLLELLESNEFTFSLETKLETVFYLNSKSLENVLKTPKVGLAASKVSAFPKVREFLTRLQRELIQKFLFRAVLEGRDAGTVVFPNTKFKFYLDAPFEVRAKRRFLEVLKNNSLDVNSPEAQKIQMEIRESLSLRDEADKDRKFAPSKPADDAKIIDTEDLGIEEVVKKILKLL